MKFRIALLCFTLLGGQALAQQAGPTSPGREADSRGSAPRQGDTAGAGPMNRQADLPDPDRLLATDPTSAGARSGAPAGPLTRQQVVAEIERARRAGEMDFAAFEVGVPASRRR